MNCVFVQIDTDIINANKPKDISDRFYNTFWDNKKSDGFYRPDSFWELPQWIAELCYTLPDDWSRELYIVKDVQLAIKYLSNQEIDILFFSSLDANKAIITSIIDNNKIRAKCIVGGYAKPYTKYTWHFWFDSIYEFCCVMGIPYKYGLDFSLFKGYKTIPRLTLSNGCTHRCKFCTIENEITIKSNATILQQVESFRPLDFRLIYLNDKTFGQASNYRELLGLSHYVRYYIESNFDGFIVQTTCNQICKPGFIDELKSFGVTYVELGIETFTDSVLKAMRKPQNSKTIHRALNLLHNSGVQVIGNIIIGLPGETMESYRHTIKMLKMYRLYSLNIYNLALYSDADLSNEIKSDGQGDNEELKKNKSYHISGDRQAIDWFYNRIYELGLKIIGDK